MNIQLLRIILIFAGTMFGLHDGYSQSKDSIPPALKLNPGPDTIELACDNLPYVDPGGTAFDDRIPYNLTSSIEVSGTVNTRRPGKYVITYKVQDVWGNKAYAVRTIIVRSTKKHGFVKTRMSDGMDMYYTNRSFEVVRNAYQWYIDDVKYGPKNSPDTLYVFNDGKPKKVRMQEWLCGVDITVDNDSANEQPVVNPYIKGVVNVDYNNNCMVDQDEQNAEMKIELLNGSSKVVYSTNSKFGQFAFYNLDPGKYTVSASVPGNNQAMVCNPRELLIDLAPNSVSENTVFNIQCGSYNDVAVNGIIAVRPVPGRIMNLKPFIGLNAFFRQLKCDTSKVSGTVIISLKGKAQYVKPGIYALKPDKIKDKVFTYNIDDFNQLSMSAFDLDFLMDTSATMEDKLEVEAYVSHIKIDIDTANNRYKSEIPVTTSYDPNLVELEPSIVEPGYSNPVIHTIHFQNTGNAEAYNIRVLDTLDPGFDPASFELLANSHPVRYSIKGHALNFHFPDIMLADSNSNEKASHGYVTFRVKPVKALIKDAVLLNTAHIYFDYNSPVSTNTGNVKVVEKPKTGISPAIVAADFNVYPNPANGEVYVECNAGGNGQIEVFDARGLLLDVITLLDGRSVYNTGKLPNGIYFLKMTVNGISSYRQMQVLH